MLEKPLVSVVMITYNHEKYIQQAVESVLMQQCNFLVELIIAEDNSPDKTKEIIKNIINDHPNSSWIKYTKHQKNKGMMPNFIWALKQTKGKYIAICDGDDYWTDPLKLQKQVDFLEANKDYNICFHNVKLYEQKPGFFSEDLITRDVSETTNVIELAKGNYIHTPSVMLRNDFILPKWFSKSPIGDWTLYMIAINDKKVKRLNDVMAVYRVHNTSIWASLSQKIRNENTTKSVKLIYKNLELSKNVRDILEFRLNDSKKNVKPILPKKLKKFLKTFKKIYLKINQ